MVKLHKEIFSLRDEIGKCSSLKSDIDVVDDPPFLTDRFLYMKKIKPLMDRYLAKPVPLEILSKNK